MSWGSLSAFLDMGGHGLYVWGSYGVAVLAIALELILLAQRRRALREDGAREA